MSLWLNHLATFGLAIFLPLSLILFSFLRLKNPQRLQLWFPWLYVWVALLFPAVFQLFAGHFSVWLITQFLLSLSVSFILVNYSKWGLLLSLVVILVALITSWEQSRHSWTDSTTTPQFNNMVRGISVLENSASTYYRAIGKSWHTSPGKKQIQLSFAARSLTDEPTWEWYRYNLDYILEPFMDNSGDDALHVTPPESANKSHYITREVFTGQPLANRIFRATVSLRSEIPQSTQGCDGIVLQENGGTYRGQCQAVNLNHEWQTFETIWQAPEGIETQNLRVVLLNLASPYDVKGLRLEEKINGIWQQITPLEPAGIVLRPQIANVRRQELPSFVFVPGTKWQTYTHTFDLTVPDHKLSFVFQLQGGAALELRNIRLQNAVTQQRLKPFTFTRLPLWFTQANLAGHTIAMLGLALTVAFRSIGIKVLIVVLTLAAISFTGSRAAFLAALLGMCWLLLLSIKVKPRVFMTALIVLVALAIFSWNTDLGLTRVLNLEDENSVKRVEIWKVAWQGFLENPWTGIGEDSDAFIKYWQSNPAAPTQIANHAHNFWLHFAITYGISGLIASLWISIGLFHLAWRWGKTQGIGIVLAMFVMNFLDYSLFYSSFLGLFVLTINTFNPEYNKPARW
jgi:hypothetical protein